MADNTKDVELRIRARDYSQKTLADVTDSLKKLADAQDEQLESAKKGEVSAKALEASYRKIEQAAQALLKQNALVQVYQGQADALQKVEEKLSAARAAQEAYARGLAGITEPTKAQQKETERLAATVERTEAAQRRAADRLASTADKLSQYGIAVNDLAGAQQRIAESVTMANGILEKQDSAINTLDADLRKLKVTQDAKLESDRKAAELARQTEQNELRRVEYMQRMQQVTQANLSAQQQKILAEREQARAEAARLEGLRALGVAQANAGGLSNMTAAQQRILAEREQIKAEQEHLESLRALGVQLAANARGYGSVASAKQVVAPKFDLAGQVQDIANPTSAAMRNMEGMNNALQVMEQRITAIRGPVQDAAGAFRQLQDVQRNTVAVAQSIDAYQRQVLTLRQARTAYVDARTAVAALVTELQSGNAGADITQRMGAAEGNLRRASTEMAKQRTATRELRDELRQAGVNTADLAGAEAKLVQQSERTAAATRALAQGVNDYGEATKKAGRFSPFGEDGGRTTLSFAQRIRGEFLAMAAASVGLYAALDLVKGAIEQVRVKAKIENGLTEVFNGDKQRAQEEMKYLRQISDEIGVVYNTAAGTYTKFAVAAKASGASIEQTRYIFEQVSRAAVRAGMSNEDYEGTLKAIEQMMSKGKVQAEELRGQLGDRLPGAMAKFAAGMNMSMADLDKALQDGKVSSEEIINFARQLEQDGGKVMDSAASNLVKSEAAFQNAKNDFQLALAESGFTDAYSNFLTKLSALLNSDAGKNLAQFLGDGLEMLVNTLAYVADHIDTISTAVGGLMSLKAASWFIGVLEASVLLVGGLKTTITTLLATEVSAKAAGAGTVVAAEGVGLLTVAVKAFVRSTVVLAAAWAVFEAGAWALDKFSNSAARARKEKAELDKAGGGKAAMADALGAGDIGKVTSTATPFPGGPNQDDRLLKAAKEKAKKNQDDLDEAERAAKMKKNKDNLAERQRLATEELREERDKNAALIKDDKKRAEYVALMDKQIAQTRSIEAQKYENDHVAKNRAAAKREESLAQKRIKLINDVSDQIKKAEDQIAQERAKRDPNVSEEEYVQKAKATALSAYNELQSKIRELAKINKGDAAEMQAKLEILKKHRVELEEIKARMEVLQKYEKQLTEAQSLRTAKLDELKAKFEGGQLGYEEYRKAVADLNVEMGRTVDVAIAKMEQFALTMKGLIPNNEFELLMSKISKMRVENNPALTNAQDDVKAREEELNRIIAERDRLLASIEARQKAGVITPDEASQQQADVYAQYKNPTLDAANRVQGSVDVLRPMVSSNPALMAQLDEIAAKMEKVRLEAGNAANQMTLFEKTLVSAAASGLDSTISTMADSFAKMATGQQTVTQGFQAMAQAGIKMFQDLIMEAIKYIIKLQIINALKNSGNPYLAAVGVAMSASTKHGGGMAGSPSGGSRSFHPAALAGAAQLHTGGMASGGSPSGLSNNEVLRVLLKNEEVVTRDDPRHVLNGGNGGGGGGSNRFVLVDDRSKIPQAMSSAEGEMVTIQHLRNNVATLKQLVNS